MKDKNFFVVPKSQSLPVSKDVPKRSSFGVHLRRRTPTEIHGVSLTQQHGKDDADINNIVARYRKTGHLPITGRTPMYGDFSNLGDYRESLDILMNAQSLFDSLPARIRERFGNDPAKYLDFMHDPKNLDEAIKLGIATKNPSAEDIANSKPASAGDIKSLAEKLTSPKPDPKKD